MNEFSMQAMEEGSQRVSNFMSLLLLKIQLFFIWLGSQRREKQLPRIMNTHFMRMTCQHGPTVFRGQQYSPDLTMFHLVLVGDRLKWWLSGVAFPPEGSRSQFFHKAQQQRGSDLKTNLEGFYLLYNYMGFMPIRILGVMCLINLCE